MILRRAVAAVAACLGVVGALAVTPAALAATPGTPSRSRPVATAVPVARSATAVPVARSATAVPVARSATAVPVALLDCLQHRVVRPRTLTVTCADANEQLVDLTWMAWNPGAAVAIGTYRYDTCTPSCAAGHMVSSPASVELRGDLQTSLGVVYRHLAWQYREGGTLHRRNFPLLATPEHLLTCEKAPEVAPASYVIACADGNTRLRGLSWRTWVPGAAVASGTLLANDCTPDCASGHFVASPATVELTGAAVGLPAGLQYTRLHVQWVAKGVRHAMTVSLPS